MISCAKPINLRGWQPGSAPDRVFNYRINSKGESVIYKEKKVTKELLYSGLIISRTHEKDFIPKSDAGDFVDDFITTTVTVVSLYFFGQLRPRIQSWRTDDQVDDYWHRIIRPDDDWYYLESDEEFGLFISSKDVQSRRVSKVILRVVSKEDDICRDFEIRR